MRPLSILAAAACAAALAAGPALAQQTPTTTTLTASQPAILYGQNFNLTATVTAAGQPVTLGTVKFLDGAMFVPGAQNVALNGSGQASILHLSSTDFGLGVFQFTADYNGSADFGASGSPVVTETIRTLTQTTLTTSADTVDANGQLTLTAKVISTSIAGVAPGSVAFYDGSDFLGAQTLDASGLASFTLGAGQLGLGASGLTAVYGGQTLYLASTSGADTVTVTAAAGGVPEPAAWALMLGGFGLAGAALRRRRRSASDPTAGTAAPA